jgi:hypothetical protein
MQREQNGNYKLLHFPDSNGFNLRAVLSKFPINELTDSGKSARLVLALQKGNLQPVTMIVDGKEQKLFLQAAPADRTLSIYDKGAVHPLTPGQVAELMLPEARQKLNGKEVVTHGPQQGKEVKQGSSLSQQNNKNENSLLSKNQRVKKRGVTLH